MYAVEFQAKVKNGIIEIPAQYRDQLKQMVRVIVLAEPDDKTSNLIDQLLENPLRVKGFKPLTRDEIQTGMQTPRFLRPFGLGTGEFSVPDDFDAPLPEQVGGAEALKQGR